MFPIINIEIKEFSRNNIKSEMNGLSMNNFIDGDTKQGKEQRRP